MAEAVIEIVVKNLSSLIQNEVAIFLGLDEDMKRLSSMLTAIKATLENAEEKQLTESDIKDWLLKLKDAAHMLNDILEDCATERLELEYQGLMSGHANKVKSSCLSSFHPKHVVFRHKISKKMKRISERLHEIAEERRDFHLHETVEERRSEVIEWRQTTSIITQPQIYGREKDEIKIVNLLVGDASNFMDLLVYPIVGMGGLGKTTLAQLVFNHQMVVNHFDLRIWVCVSEDFNLKRVSKAIIESASGQGCEDFDLEPLQRNLQELVQGKRYLLVLDDVWNDDQEKWERLKYVLTCGAKGASVLVTTRLTMVASIMGTVPPHQLSMLSENDCWELFKQRAFGPNEGEHAELLVIGKEIVKKCKGVPLAAKALGSLLRFKREETEWLYVKDSKLWSLPQDENSIMPALRLSYFNLPVKLRHCFAYCALFPKDEKISKQFLIELWMANGFISSDDMLKGKDIGEEVWNELYWRSFFQDVEIDKFGKITSFKIHDLVHDLAQSVTEEVCYITDENVQISWPERIRHLSISCRGSFDQPYSMQFHLVKSLKTCIMPNYDYADQLSPHILKCHSLRVLYMMRLEKLSSSIGHLKHLRYLNLSSGFFKTLPKSLCRLWNLQILKLEDCHYLQKLPHHLKCLKSLQHLCLRNCISLSSLPPKIGELTSLRTLNTYFVGKKRGFLLAELGCLNLKGELHIKNLERVKSVVDAKNANMANKYLTDLQLTWGRNEESELQEDVEQILEMLQPHTQHLQTLCVEGYTGGHFPQWMGSPSLKNLRHLELVDCKNCLHLPMLGKLPSLKRLEIHNMNHVKYLDNESYISGVAGGFMVLESLILEKLPNLIGLSRENGENMFPLLSILQISECPKLTLPYLPSLSILGIVGKCNQDLLSSIRELHSLESLQFNGNEELTSFPEGMFQNLSSLKILDIYKYSKLEVLTTEIINLNSIQELYINYCDSLEPLMEQVLQGLRSLRSLEIVRNRKFNLSAGFQHLTSLEVLTIGSCPEVEHFPEALQHMTTLQSLNLYDLPNLGSLPHWLGNLGMLHSLSISNCPKLMCLPMSIQYLNSLKRLCINSCSELQKQCHKEIGKDWPKIAHVMDIYIEGSCIKCQ
ncbi:hypothetical protein VNO77_01064 [Canavalia gladiata]|uniref:Disease resistance protein RGA3 n=1 Tax=Canavalia gladiata TaxID=3824 RepID=A0AAN9R9W9_CANGL